LLTTTVLLALSSERNRAPDPERLEWLTIESGGAGVERVGEFELHMDDGGNFAIRHPASPEPVFENKPGRAFIISGTGTLALEGGHGMFRPRESVESSCAEQFVNRKLRNETIVSYEGHLNCTTGTLAFYRLTFEQRQPNVLDIVVELRGDQLDGEDGAGPWISLVGASDAEESFHGFGEQFSSLDMKGHRVPIVVSEQGVGRGRQPITALANLLADDIGGDAYSSYAPIPQFITSRNRALYLTGHSYSVFDLRRPDRFEVRIQDRTLWARLIVGADPLALIETYTAAEGRMRALPDWVQSGAILGVQGGTKLVREKVSRALDAGVPVAGVWIQDWSGQRIDGGSKRLWWNWVLDDERYPEWSEMVSEFAERGIRVLTYVNPYLADVSQVFPGRRNLFAEARDQGFLVKESDGEPHILESGGLTASPIDLTNPGARQWFKDVLRDEVVGAGAHGWMADFGESMPLDREVHLGTADVALHNRYPELWAKLHRELVDELDLGDEALFFVRSGYRKSPRYATLFWLGDQLASGAAFDGIKTAVTGLKSSGLAGFAYNQSDIGGYMAIPGAIPRLLGSEFGRSQELFQRWAELSAFTAVFRTHEGNAPDVHHQFDSNQNTLAHFARMAKLYACLAPYRKRLAIDVTNHGWPLVRPLWLQYPNDATARKISYEQFQLGANIVVAPVLDPGATHVDVYLPDDGWLRIGTGEELDAGHHRVEAPIGHPAAFTRVNSRVSGELAIPACANLVQ
jgi:alpha-glucosidase